MQNSEQNSMTQDDSPLKALSSDLLGLLANGQAFSDVTFEVEGRRVYAHRCMLAARSPFFRMIFCGDAELHNGTQTRTGGTPQVIPVGIVGYDVFMLLLQFLYSGNLSFSPQYSARGCKEKTCWHTHCSSAVEFALETLNAAHFFGVDQLSTLTQKHLAAMAEKASIQDVMRILVAAQKPDDLHLWTLCSKLVAKSGLSLEILQNHLPADVVTEIESIRQKSGYGYDASIPASGIMEQRTKRMQKALDSSDVELVKLMVMGEGLNLDKAFALHYAVSRCSRKVVKTLLDLGAANVNLRGSDGRTPLHMAAQLGDPEKIAMLLDNHADPHIQTASGATAMDIVQSGATEVLSAAGGYSTKGDHTRVRLCLELVERAVALSAPPPPPTLQHRNSTKLENGSPASILTEHGSSTLMPEESDNFQACMNRVMGSSTQGAGVLGNTNFYSSSLLQGLPQGKVHGRETDRKDTSDSVSRLLYSSSLAAGFGSSTEQQALQAESRNLTSNYSILESSSLDDRPSSSLRRFPFFFTDLKDLPVLREVVLKDITNEAMDNFKSVHTPNFAEEEVSSGWQLFLQEQSESLSGF